MRHILLILFMTLAVVSFGTLSYGESSIPVMKKLEKFDSTYNECLKKMNEMDIARVELCKILRTTPTQKLNKMTIKQKYIALNWCQMERFSEEVMKAFDDGKLKNPNEMF